MGRTRSFDEDTVLWAAANLFRQRGYRDVAIADLEAATGLVSGSIYNAFGGKAGLFRAALHHYIHALVGQRLAQFAGEHATLDDLELLFLSVLEAPMADGHGCLVNNSIIEFGRADGIASEGVAETLAMVRAAIDGVLAHELGERMPPAAGMHLLVLYHGILTLSRSHTSYDAMADMVRAEFGRLKELRARAARTSQTPET